MNIPAEEPRIWSEEAQKFFGTKLLTVIDQGISVYSPHTLEEIGQDPALAIQLYKDVTPLRKQAYALASARILEYIFKNDHAKREPTTAIVLIDNLIKSAYPEWGGESCSINIFLNDIFSRIRIDIYARLVKWRHKNNEPGKFEYPFYKAFGAKFDGEKYQQAVEENAHVYGFLLGGYFEMLRFVKFLADNNIQPKSDEMRIDAAARKELNDKLAEIIGKNREFGISLCITDDPDLGSGPVTFQFNEIDTSAPDYAMSEAMVNLYDVEDAAIIKESPNLMEYTKLTPITGLHQALSATFNDSIALFIDRNGEIRGVQSHDQALKFLLGNERYELLRTHILMHFAQLVCRSENLRAALAEIIDVPEKPEPPDKNPGKPRPSGHKKIKLLPLRYMPREHKMVDVDNGKNPPRIVHKHNVAYHTRWLPLGFKPSRRAQELALDHDITLKTAVIDGNVRYQTFVIDHERGQLQPDQKDNTVLAVQAKTEEDLLNAVTKTLKDK